MNDDNLDRFSHLLTPAHLAAATVADWKTPRHLQIVNEALVEVAGEGGSRLLVNMPYQHGKSKLCSQFFPAWLLLTEPQTRVVLVAHEEEFAFDFGLHVRDVFNRWGPDLGLEIRADTKAKGTWRIAGHEGGMVCRGWHGGVVGRPADLFLIDDLLKGADQALSKAVLEAQWYFYQTVVYGRLRKNTSVVVVGTRWARGDIFGRILDMASRTGEKWKHLKFKAIATEDEPHLGRVAGGALWPDQVTLEQHRVAQMEMGRWFSAGWQQEPEEESQGYFRPAEWPVYLDVGGAYSLGIEGGRKVLFGYDDVVKMVVVDWAMSEKKGSDYTAMGVFAVLPDGRMLVLDMVNKRYNVEAAVPALAALCRVWRPDMVVVETDGFQTALANECRKHQDIPEPRRVRSMGKSKLQRALPAVLMGENQRIFLPDKAWYHADLMHRRAGASFEERDWLGNYREQLASFTGIDDKHDDMVDVTAWAAQQVNLIAPAIRVSGENEGCLLTPGKADDGGWMGGWPA